MDLANQHYTTARDSLGPPPPSTSTLIPPRVNSSGTSFPIIAVAVIGILATAFLLVSYYVFVIKCCLNWHRIDLLRRFSLSRRRNDQDPSSAYSPEIQNRGLDESVIQSIPVFKFKKRERNEDSEDKLFQECAVCLNEFQEDEKLRMIPNCCHMFHIDCIDIWLQNNSNCPLCRSSVSCEARFPVDQIPAPSSSPSNPNSFSQSTIRGDDDFVVIELDESNSANPTNRTLLEAQERMNFGEINSGIPYLVNPLPRKIDRSMLHKKSKKFNKIMSMGDECIYIRSKNDEFGVQPIRRSISMDSSADRQLYLAVQEAINSKTEKAVNSETGFMEGCSSSSGRNNRCFFYFGSVRSSRSAVLPVYLEP